MNKDEVRDVEGMNPIPGGMGQVYFQMLNTIPLDQAMEYHEYKDMNGNELNNDNDSDNNDT
jgi:hypothetical protein